MTRIIPASPEQEGVWFHAQQSGTSYWNFVQKKFFKGRLDIAALQKAFDTVLQRHDALRTSFRWEDNRLFQVIHPNVNRNDVFRYIVSNDDQYRDELPEFDFEKDILLRFTVLQSGNDVVFTLVVSHIITDAASVNIFWDELARFYNSSLAGNAEDSLPGRQYFQFVQEQQAFSETDEYRQQKAYWLEKLSSDTPPLNLRFCVPGGEVSITNRETAIPLQLFHDTRLFSLRKKVLFSAVFQLAWYILLYRITGSTRIMICNVINGRGFKKNPYRDAIGLFAKRLINCQVLSEENTVAELLASVNADLLESFANSNVSYEELLRENNQRTKRGLSPLFQALFNVIKSDDSKIAFSGLEENNDRHFEHDLVGDVLSDIGLTIVDDKFNPRLRLDINCDEAFHPMADLLTRSYLDILHECVYNASATIADIDMDAAGAQAFAKDFNDTAAPYPTDKTIVHLFAEQCLQTPEQIALVFEDQQLSYRQLDEQSNQLAHYLQRKGVKAETLVPIIIERSPDMIIGILGILKVGGAYVPIDPEYPAERIGYMLSDTGALLVLSNEQSVHCIPASFAGDIVMIDRHHDAITREPVERTSTKLKPEGLAYVIYTSGSTGRPKGVMIEHRSLTNYLLNCRERYITDHDECGSFMYLPFTFDASLTALFTPLICGKTIVVASKRNTEIFEDVLFAGKSPYDFLKLTPAHLSLLEAAFVKNKNTVHYTKRLVLGGEALQPGHFQYFHDQGISIEIVNEYGPTETTVGCSNFSFTTTDSIKYIPIGKPLHNVCMYILDNRGKLALPGIAGEICIGGIQVARGYWNLPGLTAEKFIKDPFSDDPKARLYRTGDRGRWLPGGNMEFLGRMDEQVKIRGYRVEPGEIENVAQQSGLVKQCVVTVYSDTTGNGRLTGYVVAGPDFDSALLIAYLERRLPAYMVPRLWLTLDAIPLSANGKVDRRSLPEADTAGTSANTYVAPRNELEAALVEIWQELLEVERVGIHDDFFALGGHSLLAVRMISVAGKLLELSVGDVFDYPTIAQLIDNVNSSTTAGGLLLQDRPDHIPLSFSQERLWFIDRLEGSTHYHIPWVLRIRGPLNSNALELAFGEIVNRHEVLRTVFYEEEGTCYQQVMEPGKWKMEKMPGAEYAGSQEVLGRIIDSLVAASFNLSKDHMLRVQLIEAVAPQEHILIITAHHIAADGWSWSILSGELTALYKRFVSGIDDMLPALPLQYADFAIWQRQRMQGEVLEEKLSYWQNKLSGITPLLLPLDYTRPPEQPVRGASMETEIDAELVSGLKKLSQSGGVTLFMTLLSAFKVLLYRWSGQHDICVGTPIAGRTMQETEGLIGFFINTLALRSDLGGDPSFASLLQLVRATTLEAYEHQEAPFAKVVEAVVTERDMSRSPLFQVLFVMQNAPKARDLEFGPDITLSYEQVSMTNTRFDLTVNIFSSGNSLGIYTEYCTDLFRAATVERMMLHYKELLKSVVASPEIAIGRLKMLPDAEEQQLLTAFNDTAVSYPRDKTLTDLFAAQCLTTPDHTAVEFEEQQLSYRQLDEQSNQLAHYLQRKGVKTETLVPVIINRSPDMIIGILGILKAGGAYVPIDPEYPAERIGYMLADTAASLLLTNEPTAHCIPGTFTGELIMVDRNRDDIAAEPIERPSTELKAENLAYVIYTSGSTGNPKGVMITHRNVLAMLSGFREVAPSGAGQEAGLMLCSYAFDVAVWEIFINLCFGGSLHLLPAHKAIDEEYIARYIIKKQITTAYLPPTFLPGIAGCFENAGTVIHLKRLLVGVMSIRQQVLQRFVDIVPGIRIINGYGPTETTICATFYPFLRAYHPTDNTPIGKPVKNYQVYIVNDHKMPVPVAVPGEICIAGDGVGRGYLNNEQLTEAVFVSNPFSSDKNARIYCTGDLGRWTADGNIEYAGRKDDQVKINGYRIEPGETEAVLQQSGLVQSAVVLVHTDSNSSKRLIGCIVPSGAFDEELLTGYLQKHLPEYMIPRTWVCLDAIPVTLNGKIDREALKAGIPEGISVAAYVPPRNETEAALAVLLQELLGVERVGIKDNFFSLGGNSLLAIQLIARIRKIFRLQAPVKVIFQLPRVDRLAEYIALFTETAADNNDLVTYDVYEL